MPIFNKQNASLG